MSSKKFVLVSCDDVKFEVEEGVITQSRTIVNMVEMECTMSHTISLPTVDTTTLAKVIQYCQKHAGADADLTAWDAAFIDVHHTILYHLLMAANYLDIKSLLDLSCQKVADMIKGKSPEEIRRTFNIKNDFTPEEEEEFRKENPWAFETEEKVKH